jgi:hypothetical protein
MMGITLVSISVTVYNGRREPLTTEVHAPELVDLCLELLNLDIAFGKQTTGLDQQGLQEFDIVREIGAARHAP